MKLEDYYQQSEHFRKGILITLVKTSRICTGQYTFQILLLNDDNMLGEHKGREKKYCLQKAFLENSHFVL